MYDDLIFDCPKCGEHMNVQIKARWTPQIHLFRVGDEIDIEEFIPEYRRHLMKDKLWDCPKCGSSFVFDCTSGYINIELWDNKEKLNNPKKDYFEDLNTFVPIQGGIMDKDPAVFTVIQLAAMFEDASILDFYEWNVEYERAKERKEENGRIIL